MKINRQCAPFFIALTVLAPLAPSEADADIINWQTGETIPGTEGINPDVRYDLSGWNREDHNLRFADFQALRLSSVNFFQSWLDNARFRQADLRNANFWQAMLTGADLTDAFVTNANFREATSRGFTAQQLYSTASYKNKNLRRIRLRDNDLGGWNFAGQNLEDAEFFRATLTGADLSQANLADVDFREAVLTGAHLNEATLAGANFWQATLTGADLTDAVIDRANLRNTTSGGFTAEQLYSTASYKMKDLQGIGLRSNDLGGWNFAGQNLADANLRFATLAGADLSQANLTDASFSRARLTDADLTDALVAGAGFWDTTSRGFTAEQLYSTASYKMKDLQGIGLNVNDFSGWNLAGQNLEDARFRSAMLNGADLSQANLVDASFASATLTGADLTDALVAGASFWNTTSRGFTAEQLYSTASYKMKDLARIGLWRNNLSGWNFAGQNLAEASFLDATLIGADLSGADLRGAQDIDPWRSAATRNTIWPDGEIKGLDITEENALVIRDFDLGITVTSQFTVADGGVLELLINDADWGSTVGVAADVSPQLGGTLQLGFSPEANPFGLEGEAFDLFDWPVPLAAENRFSAIESPPGILWDLSQLYTSGEVTLTAVWDPSALSLDIKPGSDPNSVNLNSRGVLPVAILGTERFDALEVDVDSLLFGDPLLIDAGQSPVAPLRSTVDDVNDDGLLDLGLKFSIRELVDSGVLGPLSVEGLLTGSKFDGTEISGRDSLRIVPSHGSSDIGNGRNITNTSLVLGAVIPVPEPSSLSLAALAIFCTFAYGRRRRNERGRVTRRVD